MSGDNTVLKKIIKGFCCDCWHKDRKTRHRIKKRFGRYTKQVIEDGLDQQTGELMEFNNK